MSRKVEKINSDHCFAQNLILCGSGPIQEPQKNVAKMTYLCKARNEASNCETDNWVHFSNAIWSYLSHHTISNSLQTLCSFWISIALFCMYLARYWAPDSRLVPALGGALHKKSCARTIWETKTMWSLRSNQFGFAGAAAAFFLFHTHQSVETRNSSGTSLRKLVFVLGENGTNCQF